MNNNQIFERAGNELTDFVTQANPYRSLLILIASLIISYWLSRFVAQFIILIAGIAIVAFLAHFIITKFFAEPLKTPALIIVGVILLVVLVAQFFPGVENYRIWH